MMDALLLGPTGLTGRALLLQLLEDPYFGSIRVFHRRPNGMKHPKLNEEIIDFDKIAEWKSGLQGDILFSALGTTLKAAGSKGAQYRVDYQYQYECARAAAANGVDTYVLISAGMADPSSRIFYSRMKGELEDAVKELPFNRIVIFRPGLLHGPRPDKRRMEGLFAQLSKGISLLPGFAHLRALNGDELARALIAAVKKQSKKEKVEIYEARDIYRLLKACMKENQ